MTSRSSVLVLALLLVSMSSSESYCSQVFLKTEAILYVNPSTTQVSVKCSFSINVTVADVTDLYGFGCCLGYNSAVLKALTATIHRPFEGPIIIDETEGYVYVTGMLPPEHPKVSGSFDLFSITLEAQSSGNTVLNLYDTVLIGSEIAPMPHTIIDGFVEVYPIRLLLETDKSTYKLGENVTITLTNISNETVVIGGYPAWQIFTYPKEEPVYPEVFIYLAWSLEPGESNSSIWNQYDEFSKDCVIPGTYVVRDLQGWGLASYFKIVYVDVIVPDDYPTIQAAINSPETLTGHTVFVSSGTYYENLVVNKAVSLIGQSRENTIIDGSRTGTAVTITVNNTNFSTFTIQNGKWEGIVLWNSGYNVIENVNVLNSTIGVMLANSRNNTIVGSTIFDNQYGIVMDGKPTTYNEIENNILSNNGWGIDLTLSDRNVISKNTVTLNSKGIHLSDSHNNTIDENVISNNKEEGVFLCYSNNNFICHNNFINNTNHVHLYNSLNNNWDNGCEGNYWSDYEERYPDATEIDHSGIWDTPYVIDENNKDNWPLMNPYWNSADVDHDLDVDLYDAIKVLQAYGSEIGDEEFNCHCDINEPYGVIDLYDAILLLVNYGEKYS